MYKIISESALLRHPLFAEYQNKEDGYLAMLYTMGIDIEKDIEEDFCTHRCEITNEVVTCIRYIGTERTDENWIKIKNQLGL